MPEMGFLDIFNWQTDKKMGTGRRLMSIIFVLLRLMYRFHNSTVHFKNDSWHEIWYQRNLLVKVNVLFYLTIDWHED